MRRSAAIKLVSMLALLVLGGGGRASAEAADGLRGPISWRFPGTRWIERDRLSAWLDEDDEPMLLDVRRSDEFAISQLEGAIRIDPGAEASELGALDRATPIVVYCSVGYRSAALAARLRKAGYARVYNLEGGLFGWANADLPLHRGEQRVATVHPYDAVWARFLDPSRRARIDPKERESP